MVDKLMFIIIEVLDFMVIIVIIDFIEVIIIIMVLVINFISSYLITFKLVLIINLV